MGDDNNSESDIYSDNIKKNSAVMGTDMTKYSSLGSNVSAPYLVGYHGYGGTPIAGFTQAKPAKATAEQKQNWFGSKMGINPLYTYLRSTGRTLT